MCRRALGCEWGGKKAAARPGATWCTSCSRAAECCAYAVSGDAPNMCVELRCESRNASEPQRSPTHTLQVRALAYDHYCDLQRPPKGAASSRRRRSAHTLRVFSRRFSRGVILIGALFEGLRLPLLRKSGRLRQNTPDGGILTSLGQNTTFAKKPLSPKQRRYNAQNGTYEGRKGQRRYPRASCLPYKG